jgi:hypothetical protein
MSDFGGYTWPKARKEHRCEWCYQKILIGEVHARFVGKWEGEFQDWRVHKECEAIMQKEDLFDGFTPGEGERPQIGVRP